MKGADRSSRDNDGILPIDLIEDNVRNDETKQILRALLETPKNSRCIGVLALSGVRQPLVKMIRNKETMFIYIGAMSMTFLGLVICVLPCKLNLY